MATHRKVYVDSRLANPGGTGSNFTFELQETVECGAQCVAFVTDLCIPVCWETVTTNNRVLYLIERSLDGTTVRRRKLAVATGQYTAQTLATALQAAFDADAAGALAGSYTVSYDTSNNRLTIANPGLTFVVVPEADLLDRAWQNANWLTDPDPAPIDYPYGLPRSINHIIGNLTPRGTVASYPYASTVRLGICDVRSHTSLYLHSEALSTYKSLTPTGSRSCIRRIPVYGGFGEVLHEGFSGCFYDFIDAGDLTLRSLDFRLLDVFGNEIDLQGGHISFAIVFGQQPV